jgi:type IV pilus assembly protein PilX
MKAPTSFRQARLRSKARQRGAALFVSMILLLLLLVLAVVGMRTVTLESRIAGNMLESQRLQETADGTLREGERIIQKYGISLAQCASDAKTPYAALTPCFTAEASTDVKGLDTDFGVNANAAGFTGPYGYWYPRHIRCVVDIGKSATAALNKCETGDYEFYELNAQATGSKDGAKECGPEALCLRSTVNLFIK